MGESCGVCGFTSLASYFWESQTPFDFMNQMPLKITASPPLLILSGYIKNKTIPYWGYINRKGPSKNKRTAEDRHMDCIDPTQDGIYIQSDLHSCHCLSATQ